MSEKNRGKMKVRLDEVAKVAEKNKRTLKNIF
jgi:hypothetical protein